MIMSARTFSLGLLATALLAGTATSALAWSPKKERLNFEHAEELPTELQLELDPSWPLLAPDTQPSISIGAVPSAPIASATAFSPQETQSAIARAIKSGYSVGATPDQFPAEMNRGYAVTNKFSTAVRAGFDAPVGDEMRMTAAGAEARYNLGHLGPAISWGWNTGLDMTLQTAGTSAIESGPQFKMGGDQLALTLSPKVAHNFGPHQEGDVAFAYAAGLKGEIANGVALGIEAFGSTADIASVPGTALQTHRSAPGLYVGLGMTPRPLGDPLGSKFSLELGALTSMSETQPDWAGKLKAAVTW
jgi:hypothetical protein